MIFTTSDGIDLYYEISGKGAPCLFLHGGPGYWSKSFQVFAAPLLEDNLQMIYLDQRGCGRSAHSSDLNYSLSRLIEDIEEWREHNGINEMYVMGHSFGGILAVNYANQYPKRTKGIILSNVTLHMYESFEHQIHRGNELLGNDRQELQRDDMEGFISNTFSFISRLMEKDLYYTLQFDNMDNKVLLDSIDKEGIHSDPQFQEQVLSQKQYFQDFTDLTENIVKPVLVIAGERDHSVGPTHHTTFRFSDVTTIILNSSHHPYLEDPINYRDAILTFLQTEK